MQFILCDYPFSDLDIMFLLMNFQAFLGIFSS